MHYVDFGDVQRNLIRTIVPHRANELAVAERMVAGELDLTDFYLRSFFNLENQNNGGARSNALILRRNFRKLTAVFAQQFLDHHFSLFNLCGIKLALDRQADFALLESSENV